MNEDECCLICLDETLHVNCILECCGKKVHSSCIKQWWNIQNMELNDALCPHCRQSAKLKKIINIKKSRVMPINYPNQNVFIFPNQSINPAFGVGDNNIRPNLEYDLTDDDILEINSNSNNFIPRNNFRYDSDDSSNESSERLCNFIQLGAILGILIMILLIIYLWLVPF